MDAGVSKDGVLRPERVLVVDDEPAVGRSLGRLLGAAGFEVEVAASGVAALAAVDGGDFDVVLSDIQMPDMTGVELLQQIRATDAAMPVILMTGDPRIETAAKAVELGALLYLIKPIEPEYLRRMVAEAAKRGAVARASRQAPLLGREAHPADDRNADLSQRFDNALVEINMHFQPIVNASDGTVAGYEALYRSREPSLANPGVVFEAAEKLSRVQELGRRIREDAAAHIAHAPDGALIFVNLHARDLSDEHLHDAASALTAHSSRVVLEITERAAVRDVQRMSAGVHALRAQGFRIAVDDLGAGYAGLTSFALLEPEFVKLDMSIVRDAHKSELKRRLIESMTQLCKDMGIRVVAEGIETIEELTVVRNAGCDFIQGFLLGRPAPPFASPSWPL